MDRIRIVNGWERALVAGFGVGGGLVGRFWWGEMGGVGGVVLVCVCMGVFGGWEGKKRWVFLGGW